jgi:hypothetical protein
MVPERGSVRAAWWPGVALYLMALGAALALGSRGPVYWDSAGYVAQAITGRVGGLALGRPLFVLVSHAVSSAYLSAHGSAWNLEPVLRHAWMLVSAIAAPASWDLARRCGVGDRASILAGLAVAFSPAFAHTSGVVLTDAPALAVSTLSLVAGARSVGIGVREREAPSLRFASVAGACAGISFGLREQSLVVLAPMALMIPLAPRPMRARVAAITLLTFLAVSMTPLAYLARTQPAWWPSVRAWIGSMHREDASHQFGALDVGAYFAWLLSLGPATLVAAILGWTRRARTIASFPSVSLAVCVPSLVQLALLSRYPDIAFSPRYLLPALPGALAIPAAVAVEPILESRRHAAAVAVAMLLIPALVAAPFVHSLAAPVVKVLDETPAALMRSGPRLLVVTGEPCTSVLLAQTIVRRERGPSQADWETICPGWGWPQDLTARLDAARADRRTVVIDLRDAAWIGDGQRARRAEAVGWLAVRHSSDAIVWR